MDLGDAFSEGYHFQEQKVQSAGPPWKDSWNTIVHTYTFCILG
jgi:hypothetical protein